MSLLDGEQTSQLLRHVYSSDLDACFKIKVGTLEGERPLPPYQDIIQDPILRRNQLSAPADNKGLLSDLVVTVEIFSDGRSLALPTQTSYKPFTTRYNWNEWLTLPLKFSDLPRDSILAFTVWDLHGHKKAVPVGGTTVSIFKKSGAMRQGMHDLKLWENSKADGSNMSSTPGKISGANDEMARLTKLTKKHHIGEMARVDWMDRLTFKEITYRNNDEKKKSNQMFLMIEFPRVVYRDIEHMVVYFEKDLDVTCQSNTDSSLAPMFDPDVWLDNLVEDKHHKLSRNIRTERIAKDLKPNAATRDQLHMIVSKCSTTPLTADEQDLVWKYRFYLKDQKKAMARFVHCVKWDAEVETLQALDLMRQWEPMDVEDALELLGPQFKHKAVRRYAVTRLEQASDEDLLLYLLQLVQALKYEPPLETASTTSTSTITASSMTSSTAPSIAPSEQDQPLISSPGDLVESQQSIESSIASATEEDREKMSVHESTSLLTAPLEDNRDLATFLIKRASRSDILANYLYWYLKVESDGCSGGANAQTVNRKGNANLTHANMYAEVSRRLLKCLKDGNREQDLRRRMLSKQDTFVKHLVDLMKTVAADSVNRQKKIEKLQLLLSDSDTMKSMLPESLALPLNPKIRVKSLVAKKAELFKSALMPCKLTFLTEAGEEYYAIFKHGDDLRQDQLILQVITLMDRLLRRENLDLQLTPYCVLATSPRHGFVEFIESKTVAEVLREYTTIELYLKTCSGGKEISKEVMDNYVKSCAGYCVITYLLGVGDRHLDNLLLTKQGRLFHIDFGYILGRDPKPFPPPMKLSREMVEAMGGMSSEIYNEFKKHCYTTFLHLRRHANLILNLFSLMVDASVPDIALEPDKTVKKVQDKFMLEMTDEEAVSEMQRLIDSSASAVMPSVVDNIHKWAQYWRK